MELNANTLILYGHPCRADYQELKLKMLRGGLNFAEVNEPPDLLTKLNANQAPALMTAHGLLPFQAAMHWLDGVLPKGARPSALAQRETNSCYGDFKKWDEAALEYAQRLGIPGFEEAFAETSEID